MARRPERLLYGPLRAAQEFSVFDARAKAELGPIDGVEVVFPLVVSAATEASSRLLVLLVFPTRLVTCEMAAPTVRGSDEEDGFLDAVMRSSDTILTQLFKPAASALDGLKTQLGQSTDNVSIRNVESDVAFADIAEVHVRDGSLEVAGAFGKQILPMNAASKEVRAELQLCIERSIKGRFADWSRLRDAVWRERSGENGLAGPRRNLRRQNTRLNNFHYNNYNLDAPWVQGDA